MLPLGKRLEAAGLEFLHCGARLGSFVPFDKGDAALFCGRGSLEFTAEDPLWSPFSRGTKLNSQTIGLASKRLDAASTFCFETQLTPLSRADCNIVTVGSASPIFETINLTFGFWPSHVIYLR